MDSILGALDIEKESFQTAKKFSWIFFPIWIMLAIVQAIGFLLSNEKFHPLVKILEGCDVNIEGNCCTDKETYYRSKVVKNITTTYPLLICT